MEEKRASSSEYDVSMRQRIEGAAGLDLAADLDAVAVGQPHVEDGHVGLELPDELQSLFRRARLADDLHVALAVEQRPQAGPDELVIVEQEDTDRHRANNGTAPAGPDRDAMSRA